MKRLCMVAVVLGGLVAGCRHAAEEDDPGSVQPVVDVQVDTVRVATLRERVQVTGSTRALRQETIGAPVAGRVAHLAALEGDVVQAGALVAQVETEESAAAVRGAERLVGDATTEEERVRAGADVERARTLRTLLDVRAPFDGVVAVRHLHEGEWVAAGAPLVTVVDLGSLVFVARVPPRFLSRIHPPQDADIRFPAWPGRAFRARVESAAPAVDLASQAVEVRLRFVDRATPLRVDLFGAADVVVDVHANVLCVPRRALRRDDETGACTVVEAVGDSLGVVRAVTAGVETDSLIQITGPTVRRGMRLVGVGAHGLPDSTRLRVTDAP